MRGEGHAPPPASALFSMAARVYMATQARTDLLSTISRSMTSGGGAWVPDRLQSDVQATVTKRPQQLGRGLFKGEANGASQTDWAAHVAALPSVSDSKMGTYATSPKLRNWEGAHHPRQQSERKPAYLVDSEIIRASTFNPGTCRKWQPDALGRAWP